MENRSKGGPMNKFRVRMAQRVWLHTKRDEERKGGRKEGYLVVRR